EFRALDKQVEDIGVEDGLHREISPAEASHLPHGDLIQGIPYPHRIGDILRTGDPGPEEPLRQRAAEQGRHVEMRLIGKGVVGADEAVNSARLEGPVDATEDLSAIRDMLHDIEGESEVEFLAERQRLAGNAEHRRY